MRDVKWGTIIPLVGGSATGCYDATGVKPSYHLSYSAFDKNERPLEEYWPEVPRIKLDENNDLPTDRVDFINTVCPCAGLSLLSTAKTKEVRDKSNKWMLESADVVLGQIKPRVFWGENAPGLFTNMGSWVREILIEKAKKYGYSFSLYRTTTSKHGIPQNRLRTFYFFWDSKTPPILNYYDRPKKSFGDFLEEIPKWATSQNEYQFQGEIGDNSKTYLFILDKLEISHREFVDKYGDGGSIHSVQTFVVENKMIDECIDWIEKNFGDSKELTRLKKIREKVAKGGRFMDGSPAYYKSTCNALVGRNLVYITHPYYSRYLSIREIMHMMGMPHNFKFSTQQYNVNLLAQNVPSCTARDMTLEVLKFLNNELDFYEHEFLKQDNIKKKVVL